MKFLGFWEPGMEKTDGIPRKLSVGIFGGSLTSIRPGFTFVVFFDIDMGILYNTSHNKLCEAPTTSELAPR
jgi:hypothetical protein